MTALNRPSPPLRVFDVSEFLPITGVGKTLGRVEAETLANAEAQARAKFGRRILVSPAGGRKNNRAKTWGRR